MAEKKPFERLPTNVIPCNYKVELTPDLQAFTFKGNLEITCKVNQPTSQVVMNSAELEISFAKWGEQEAKCTHNKEAETLTLEFPSELPLGEATLSIEYTGTLNDQMRGFYRSQYSSPDNPEETRYAAVTQFEDSDARRALPCWDEPAHKATFDVILNVPRNRIALSNMNVVTEEEIPGDMKRLTFARTPVMSSYLLAFIVGEFDYVEATDSNGVLVRVYTPLGKAEQGRYALEVAVKTLPFYQNYFNVAYPLPKLDLIAIADFAAGAMENWGLVTYRERRLLVDPTSSSATTKQDVALVVGHELAHQWFGNLVTMEWWTHLWLNEGFATWIEYLCVDHTHPEFDIWTYFLSHEYIRAQSLDALSNSHPIEVPVGPPSEVEEIFDVISYAKGACIIRMLHDWIGTENFRTGLGNYLKKFQYKNTRTEDLWEALENVSKKPVEKVMSTWTKQMGYPVLSVEGKQNGSNKIITISQKKFCADGDVGEFGSMLWKVPVTIATKNNPEAVRFLLDTVSTTVTVEGVGPEDWILLNPGRQGFYCVSYSSDLFSLLLPALKGGTLSAQDRLGLQNDAFALARAGVGSTVDVLRLLSAFSNESCYTVWESIVSNMSVFNRLFSYTDFYEDFRRYAMKIFKPSVEKLGWDTKETDGPVDVMLRSLIIGQLGEYNNPDTVAEAKRRFQDHIQGTNSLNSDMKSSVYSICMANGDLTTFNQLVELHDKSDSNEEKVRIYQSLGSGKTPELTKMCLDLIFSDKVRAQDCWYLMSSASNSCPQSRDIAWKFLQDKWPEMKEKFQGQFLLARMIKVSTGGFVSESCANEVEGFFTQNPWPVADRILKQNCEAIRLSANWLERDKENVQKWLASQ